ncbi:MAG: tetratricopeptide repeat protein [Bdellovibrionales bacterium]|nr:tetratricopeptide repeat protein [Bdellovibrionales bacterium]
MITMRQVLLFSVTACLALFFQSCVDSTESNLEQVRSLLDQARYEEAEALASTLYNEDPTNLEAKYFLAEASLANGALSGNPNCPAGDVGLLGLLACIQDPAGAGETEFETFRKIAPSSEEKIAKVETATNLLAELAVSEISSQNIYLLLFLSRLFEIAGSTTRVGSDCSVNLTAEQEARFSENLDVLPSDGNGAGLPSDLGLYNKLDTVKTALEVSASNDFPTFFTNELCS